LSLALTSDKRYQHYERTDEHWAGDWNLLADPHPPWKRKYEPHHDADDWTLLGSGLPHNEHLELEEIYLQQIEEASDEAAESQRSVVSIDDPAEPVVWEQDSWQRDWPVPMPRGAPSSQVRPETPEFQPRTVEGNNTLETVEKDLDAVAQDLARLHPEVPQVAIEADPPAFPSADAFPTGLNVPSTEHSVENHAQAPRVHQQAHQQAGKKQPTTITSKTSQGSSFGLSSTLVPSAIHTDKPAIRTDKFLLPTALQKRTEPDAGPKYPPPLSTDFDPARLSWLSIDRPRQVLR